MSITLTTLFTTPNDIWDELSTYGVDLRLDDNNLASGQVIRTSATTAIASTSMSVVALPTALLAGAVLTFENAAMADPVQVSLTAAASVGATTISVASTTAAVPSDATARDSGVNAATGARLLVACRKGTSKVKLYCNSRYDDSQLRLAGSACDWATTYGCMWLCERRSQECPKSLRRAWDEAKEELRQVQVGQLMLEDIGTRGADWPTVTNVIVNPGYDGMRARVQTNISEQTPTAFNQYIDWNSAALIEF